MPSDRVSFARNRFVFRLVIDFLWIENLRLGQLDGLPWLHALKEEVALMPRQFVL